MIRKTLDKGAYALTSIFLTILGCFLLWKRQQALAMFVWLVGAVMLLQGLFFLVLVILGKEGKRAWGSIVASFLMALLCLCFPKLPMSMITLLFAIYLCIHSIIKGINAYLLWHAHAMGSFREAFGCCFYAVFAMILAMAPYFYSKQVMVCFGVYCLALGLTYAKDLIPVERKTSLKRKIRITLPVWVCALLPKQMLNQLNTYLQGETPTLSDEKLDDRVDLMVYIHATQSGFGMIGHIDIDLDGYIASYGNYDLCSTRLFEALGDGVMFFCEDEHYLSFCRDHEKNTIFAFGLQLTPQQKQRVHTCLNRLKEEAVQWQPAIVTEPNKAPEDFASRLYLACHATFFKFQKGKFKNYFVLGSNCVKFVDDILGETGSDVLNLRGFLSPGTYLHYLQEEYLKEHSFVVTQSIYPYVNGKAGNHHDDLHP